MEKKSSRGDLITWYLARLRNNARQSSLERKLTPLTLVQTDKHLIQEIVMQSHVSYEKKCSEVLQQLQTQNQNIRTTQTVLLVLTVLGALALLVLLFS